MADAKPEATHTAHADVEHSSASEKRSQEMENPAQAKPAEKSYIPQSDEEYNVTYVHFLIASESHSPTNPQPLASKPGS
jgi:hypothetical protein